MPEYLAPGVYVEEVDTGSKPIEGVSTSTSGMVGVTERGPLNIATLVTSFADFDRQFGGYLDYREYEDKWYLPHAVEGFFRNGGKRVYIVRVLPETATFSETCIDVSIENSDDVTPEKWQLGADASRGDMELTLSDVTNMSTGMWLQLGTGNSIDCVYVTRVDAATNVITIDQALRFDQASGTELGESSTLIVQAIDKGRWGNDLQVKLVEDKQGEGDNLVTTTLANAAATGANTLTLNSVVGIEPGTIIEANFTSAQPTQQQAYQQGQFYKVSDVDRNNRSVTVTPALTANIDADTPVRSREFSLRVELVQLNPLTRQTRTLKSEVLRNLATDPRHSRYAAKVIGPIRTIDTPIRADGRTDGESELIRVAEGLTEGDAGAAIRTGPSAGASHSLGGGNDDQGNIFDTTYMGEDSAEDPLERKGIYALKNIDGVSIVAVPGQTGRSVQGDLINHCELMRYRFAVLDSREKDKLAAVQQHRGLYDTKYAAIYYPWLKIPDPFPENPQARGTKPIPPSGHIMGIYARSDIERGVHKAPANEVIRGISDLEVKLTKEQQDILNPRNINALRDFRENNRGLRVWGARALTSDTDWKYINVRRLFIFIEHSIDRGTQWVVFEPNNEELWPRVRRVITAFLTNVWRDGALMGTSPEEAFFVKCDRTTMSQYDIDNGRLIVQVGIAPTKPAEFVIFRIGQWTGGSSLEEGA